MNIRPAQKKVIDALLEDDARVVIHRRKKPTSSAVNFGYFVAAHDDNGNELNVLKMQSTTLESMVNSGMLSLVAQDNMNGYTYVLSDKLKLNRNLLAMSNVKAQNVATNEKLQTIAEKFFCKISYDAPAMLFKVERMDGREFSEPYIDESADGIKVTALRDLSLNQWQEEVINVIRRSSLLD